MSDTTQNPPTEMIDDLETPQPTSAEAALVRGGMPAIGAVVKIPFLPINLGQGANEGMGTQGGSNDPAQMFQQILNQVMQGG